MMVARAELEAGQPFGNLIKEHGRMAGASARYPSRRRAANVADVPTNLT
jgi:hypothetical protein